jgi:hypothetical protein
MAKKTANVFELLSVENQCRVLIAVMTALEPFPLDAKAAAESALEAVGRDSGRPPFSNRYLTPPLGDQAQLKLSNWIIAQASCLTVRQAYDLLTDEDKKEVLTNVETFCGHFRSLKSPCAPDAKQDAASSLADLLRDPRLQHAFKTANFTPPLSDEARLKIKETIISLACRRPPANWLAMLSRRAQKDIWKRVVRSYDYPSHAEEAFSQLGICLCRIGLNPGVSMERPIFLPLELKIIEMISKFACGPIMRKIVRKVFRGDQRSAPSILGSIGTADSSEEVEQEANERAAKIVRIAKNDISKYCNKRNKFHKIHLFDILTTHPRCLSFFQGNGLSNIALLEVLQHEYPDDKWTLAELKNHLEWLRDYLSANRDVQYQYPKARKRHQKRTKTRESPFRTGTAPRPKPINLEPQEAPPLDPEQQELPPLKTWEPDTPQSPSQPAP